MTGYTAEYAAGSTPRGASHRGSPPVVRVSLLIPSHALPPFSYLVPERLSDEVRVGTAVVAPLSGYPRLGVVVGFEEEAISRPLQKIRTVLAGLSLPEGLVKLCSWAAGAAALPPHTVLRMALPPGLATSVYEVRRPAPGWPWKAGSTVTRAKLRRTLGGEGLKAAEKAGRIRFAPAPLAQRTVEWAVREEGSPAPPRRAIRQRDILEALAGHERGRPVADLLREAGAGRDALRRLVGRGAVRLEKRPEAAPLSYTRGSGAGLSEHAGVAEQALSRGGSSWVWRMPDASSTAAAAAVARAAAGRGEQTLVLAPDSGTVERLVEAFEELLPAGLTVTPYHGGLGRGRAAVYEAARRGEVDVLVGTRASVLVPFKRLGAICVVDEPNGAHRGSPGYEGVPMHVRDLARARGRIEDAGVFFFSPVPSLRLYAPESGARRLPPIEPARWPAVAVVDMRGTGAALSSALISACRRTIRIGGRAGVLVNRAGDAASLACNGCGYVWRCPACDAILSLRGTLGEGTLFCGRCGHEEDAPRTCRSCGSNRLGGAGLAIERVRIDLASALGVEVGLTTASRREGESSLVIVGTARCVLEGAWDLVAIPGADSLLFAGSVEKGFRLLYGAAEASRERLLVQTRSPEHPALSAALRGDYAAFAAAELPKRRALMYPPHAHLADITFKGSEEAVRRAVESRLRPYVGDGVELLDPVPLAASPEGGGRPVWRMLLKSRKRGALAKAAALVARLAAESRGRDGLEARINMDPEEV